MNKENKPKKERFSKPLWILVNILMVVSIIMAFVEGDTSEGLLRCGEIVVFNILWIAADKFYKKRGL